MGWCSATEIFDAVVEPLLADGEVDREDVIDRLIGALEDGDWDCQDDSRYADHPTVVKLMKARHPGRHGG